MPGDPQSHQNICTRHGAGTLTSPERLDSGTHVHQTVAAASGAGERQTCLRLQSADRVKVAEQCSAVQRSAGPATLAWTVRGMRGATALRRCSVAAPYRRVQPGAAQCRSSETAAQAMR